MASPRRASAVNSMLCASGPTSSSIAANSATVIDRPISNPVPKSSKLRDGDIALTFIRIQSPAAAAAALPAADRIGRANQMTPISAKNNRADMKKISLADNMNAC